MVYATDGGHKDLVEFFVEKGADDWDWAMEHAIRKGHEDLQKFFIKKGANGRPVENEDEYDDEDEWM